MPHPTPTGPRRDGVAAPALVRGTTPFDDLEISLRLLCTGPAPLAVDGRRLGHGLPRRMIPLHELAAVLMHPSTSYQAREAAWRLLVANARTGAEKWIVGAVGVALPGLRRAAGRLARATSRTDVQLDLLEAFTTELATDDLDTPRLCARLCNAAYIAARKKLTAEQAAASGEANAGFGSMLPPRPYGHPDFVLARAVACGVITAEESELIGATYLEETTLAEYADRVELSRRAAYHRRGQAVAKLVAALRAGRLADPDAEAIAEATLTTVVGANTTRHRP